MQHFDDHDKGRNGFAHGDSLPKITRQLSILGNYAAVPPANHSQIPGAYSMYNAADMQQGMSLPGFPTLGATQSWANNQPDASMRIPPPMDPLPPLPSLSTLSSNFKNISLGTASRDRQNLSSAVRPPGYKTRSRPGFTGSSKGLTGDSKRFTGIGLTGSELTGSSGFAGSSSGLSSFSSGSKGYIRIRALH